MRTNGNARINGREAHADASFTLGGQRIGGTIQAKRPENQPYRADAYLGLRFWVEIGQVQVAGFTECSGFQIETEFTEYHEGGENSFVHKLPTRQKFTNITLKRGIDEAAYFYHWYTQSQGGKTHRRDITIHIYNALQKSVVSWCLHDAYPVKWTAPDLKADTGGVAVESVEIAFHGVVPVPTKEQTHSASAKRTQEVVSAVRNNVSLDGSIGGNFGNLG